MLDEGADITLLPDSEMSAESQTMLASAAARTDLLAAMVRLSIQQPDSQTATAACPEKRTPVQLWPASPAPRPPFYRLARRGEATMTTLLASKIPDNSMVIDLFCGAGTLSLGLLPRE